MLKKKKIIKEDIIVIDPRFPGDRYMGFTAHGIIGFFNLFPSSKSYHYTLHYPPCTGILAGLKIWAKRTINYLIGRKFKKSRNNILHYYSGKTKKKFNKNKKKISKIFPEHHDKINFLDYTAKYQVKLAYLIFINTAYDLLPFLEKNQIPFVVLLYPGGGFSINNSISEKKMRAVFESTYFRKVIVTHVFTKKYLINRQICNQEFIHMFKYKKPWVDTKRLKNKQKYPTDKDSFDLVFVAYKYMKKGLDKGYDIFVDAAKALTKQYKDMHFHVVGNFYDSDIDVSEIRNRITFYGVRDTAFLIDLYSNMDIFLSPNRPFVLSKGRFDGFPLGGHAQFCGVALFVSDELNLNDQYTDDEIVIIKPDVDDVVQKVEHYYINPKELYDLSQKGQLKRMSFVDEGKSKKERHDFFDGLLKSK